MVVDSSKNKVGCFLRVLKIDNRETKVISQLSMLLEDGKYLECLKSFFLKSNSQKGSVEKEERRKFNVVKLNQNGRQFHRSNIMSTAETSPVFRDANLAVVIIKNRSQVSWWTIKVQMQRKVGRNVDVVPFADDKSSNMVC